MFLFWRSGALLVHVGSSLSRGGLSIPSSPIPRIGASNECQLVREHLASQGVVWSKPHQLQHRTKPTSPLASLLLPHCPDPLGCSTLFYACLPYQLSVSSGAASCHSRFCLLPRLDTPHSVSQPHTAWLPLPVIAALLINSNTKAIFSQSLSGRCLSRVK